MNEKMPESANRMRKWTESEVAFLVEHYPDKGKSWVAEQLGRKEGSVRARASELGLRLNHKSEFFNDFQRRAASSKVGVKRPAQALVMKANHASGKLKKTPEQCAAMGLRSAAWIAKNGHPKGALGLKHSQETLKKLSEKSIAGWSRMTDEGRVARTMKAMRTRERNGTSITERPGASWKAGWREIGGIRKYYRSKWEANYAHYLEWLRQGGHIASWKHEPKTFWFEGVKRGCVSYLPDFHVVANDGTEAYHEVKGWMDDRSKTKIRRMAKYHPAVNLVVVDSKAYALLKKQVSRLVPGWEE